MKLSDVKDLAMIGGLGYLVYLFASGKFNPFSDKNAAYQTASEAIKFASGGKYLTVGDWLYGMFGADTLDPIQFSPFILPNGQRSSRVTRVARIRDGKMFNIDYSGATPRLVPV